MTDRDQFQFFVELFEKTNKTLEKTNGYLSLIAYCLSFNIPESSKMATQKTLLDLSKNE